MKKCNEHAFLFFINLSKKGLSLNIKDRLQTDCAIKQLQYSVSIYLSYVYYCWSPGFGRRLLPVWRMWRAEAARNWWGFFHWRDDWPQPGLDPPRDWDKQGDSVNAKYRVFTIANGHCELGRCPPEQWLGMIRMWGLISGQCPYPAWQGTHGPGSRQCGPVNTYCHTVSLYYHSSPNWSQPADTQQIDSYQPQVLPSAATKLAPVQYLQT